jgi:hypothetical protein
MNKNRGETRVDDKNKILAEIAEFQRTHRAFEDFSRMAKLLLTGRMTDTLFAIFNKQLADYRGSL